MLTLTRSLALASLALALGAGSGSALASISLSEPAAEVAADACPQLTQIKYPWLRCTTHADGTKSLAGGTVPAIATWENSRQIPLGYGFIEGDGAYQPYSTDSE